MNKPPFSESEVKDILKRYSLESVLHSIAGGTSGGSFEREISDDYNKRLGRDCRGVLTIPDFCLCRALAKDARRSGSILNYENGAAFVTTDLLRDRFIAALAERTVLGKAGISTLGGLRGDIAIPKVGVVSASWLADGEAAPAVVPETSQLTASPHCVGATCTFSRRLSVQASSAVERIVAETIADSLARAIETAAFLGSGTEGEPTGLANTADVQTASISATPTKAELVAVWRKTLEANVPGDAFAFIGAPSIMATLSSTLDVREISNGLDGADEATVGAVSSGRYLCTDGKVEGHPFLPSGLCGTKLWFGDWAQLVLCSWSGTDIRVDPFTLSTSGAIRLTALKDVDILVRNPEAFVMATVSAG